MNKLNRFLKNVPFHGKRFMSGKKRKYPINPDDEKLLPIFEYSVSKKTYRRVFAWGNIQTGALGVPYLERNESVDKISCFRSPKRIGFGEKFEVTTAGCGFGFTAFAINSDDNVKVYGCGINTDSQLSYHAIREGKPLGILFYPQPIHLPFKHPEKSKIKKIAAGRAHLAVLSDEGLFLLGNNSYGQCGREIIKNEDYTMGNFINHIDKIDEKTIVDVECGQDHSLALLEDGSVYSCGWGADGQTGLNHFKNASIFTRVQGDISSEKIVKLACRSDFVLALNDKGEVYGWGNTEYSQITLPNDEQQLCNPVFIEMIKPLGRIEDIGSGGSSCLVLNENGEVFAWGYGLLGVGPNVEQSKVPVKIPDTLFGKNDYQPNNKVEKIRCGLSHFAAITNLGHLYVWGRNRSGCLGLGDDKDQYFPLKVAISGYPEDVCCGLDHTIAVCKPFI